MTTYEVGYAPEAIEDLRAIYMYIADRLQAPITATRQVARLREAIKSLDLFPQRHERVAWIPWENMDLRRLPIDRYVIFYQIEETQVIVLRIFYGGRNIKSMDDLATSD